MTDKLNQKTNQNNNFGENLTEKTLSYAKSNVTEDSECK